MIGPEQRARAVAIKSFKITKSSSDGSPRNRPRASAACVRASCRASKPPASRGAALARGVEDLLLEHSIVGSAQAFSARRLVCATRGEATSEPNRKGRARRSNSVTDQAWREHGAPSRLEGDGYEGEAQQEQYSFACTRPGFDGQADRGPRTKYASAPLESRATSPLTANWLVPLDLARARAPSGSSYACQESRTASNVLSPSSENEAGEKREREG